MFQLVQDFPSCSKLVYIFLPIVIAVSIGLKLPPPPKKKRKKCLKDNTGAGSIIFSVKIPRSINCMQCILPYVQKEKERKLFLKANVLIMISPLFFAF